MFKNYLTTSTKSILLAGTLAGSFVCVSAVAQSTAPAGSTPPASSPSASSATATSAPFHFHENRPPRRAEMYYKSVWGVDSLRVKEAESGEMIRFTWRVLDADRAKTIHDKKLEPVLIDPQAGVKLIVPSLEKVGQLRQSSTPIVGKSYWMAFSNKGHVVKPGDHVTVRIGNFHADDLMVE